MRLHISFTRVSLAYNNVLTLQFYCVILTEHPVKRELNFERILSIT